MADFNGDSRVDLAMVSSGGVSVLLNLGTGTFATKVDYTTGPALLVAAVDLNSDGRPDLVTLNQSNETVSALLNLGATLAPKVDYPPAPRRAISPWAM